MCLILYNDYILGDTNSRRQIVFSLILEMRKRRLSSWLRGPGRGTQVSMYPGPLTLLAGCSTLRASSALLTINVLRGPDPQCQLSLFPTTSSLCLLPFLLPSQEPVWPQKQRAVTSHMTICSGETGALPPQGRLRGEL